MAPPPDSDQATNLDKKNYEWRQLADKFKLTPRQLEAARLLVEGNPHKRIARRMQITINSVNTHLKRVYDKTGSANTVELVFRVEEFFRSLSPNR